MSRIRSRSINGRFRQSTMENTFGLSVEICTECGRMTSYRVGEAKPKKCQACGKSFALACKYCGAPTGGTNVTD
jgi:hypothetical protein